MKAKTKQRKYKHNRKQNTANYAVLPIIILVLAIGVSSAIAVSALSPGNGNNNPGSDNPEPDTIITTGMASMSIDPNKLEVYVGAEIQAATAEQSQQKNAEIINNIRAALISSGIDADSINTHRYNIYPIRDYTEYGKSRIIGYRTIHILKVESENINLAGSIIDTAVENGANKVENVLFTLTAETMSQYRIELLADAALNAREKADSIAGALGVSIVKVHMATESYYNYMPYKYSYPMAAGAEYISEPTQITPGQIDISATVTVAFEIA